MKLTFLLAALFVLACTPALGQYQVLYNFPAGAAPLGGLVFDQAGNLYGTTSTGGAPGCFGRSTCGTVFELSPSSGGWTETTLYNFCSTGAPDCPDGWFPLAGLAIDPAGNLYGTAQGGGNQTCTGGCGVVFELSPPGAPGGTWTYANLHTFCSAVSCADGALPRWGSLTLDRHGNLYGTASQGGSGQFGDGGTVFKLSPGTNGWTLTVLYSFCSTGHNDTCTDGVGPQSSVTFDSEGNLYGTAMNGGEYSHNTEGGAGLVFKLSQGHGGWTETILYEFPDSGFKGANPTSTVTLDPAGSLYTTFSDADTDGLSGVGRIGFDGSLSEIRNGELSYSGVLLDVKRRMLYGTTFTSIYQINSSSRLTVISDNGAVAYGNLIEDAAGNLYGVSSVGGTFGGGVVFEVTP